MGKKTPFYRRGKIQPLPPKTAPQRAVLPLWPAVLPLPLAVLPLGLEQYYRGYFRGYFRSGPKTRVFSLVGLF